MQILKMRVIGKLINYQSSWRITLEFVGGKILHPLHFKRIISIEAKF